MEIRVERKWPKTTYTIGIMYVDGVRFCETLEDKVRDLSKEEKVYGETAIPAGRYRVIYNYSPKFKRNLPRLLNVPHFEGILIHPGNTAEDSAGCILVGRNTSIGKLSESRAYSDKLNKLIEEAQLIGEDIFIEVL